MDKRFSSRLTWTGSLDLATIYKHDTHFFAIHRSRHCNKTDKFHSSRSHYCHSPWVEEMLANPTFHGRPLHFTPTTARYRFLPLQLTPSSIARRRAPTRRRKSGKLCYQLAVRATSDAASSSSFSASPASLPRPYSVRIPVGDRYVSILLFQFRSRIGSWVLILWWFFWLPIADNGWDRSYRQAS